MPLLTRFTTPLLFVAAALVAHAHAPAVDMRDAATRFLAGLDAAQRKTATYTLTDAQGATALATVSITVNAVNDAPVVASALGTVAQNTGVALSVSAAAGFSDDSEEREELLDRLRFGLRLLQSLEPAGIGAANALVFNPDGTVTAVCEGKRHGIGSAMVQHSAH